MPFCFLFSKKVIYFIVEKGERGGRRMYKGIETDK